MDWFTQSFSKMELDTFGKSTTWYDFQTVIPLLFPCYYGKFTLNDSHIVLLILYGLDCPSFLAYANWIRLRLYENKKTCPGYKAHPPSQVNLSYIYMRKLDPFTLACSVCLVLTVLAQLVNPECKHAKKIRFSWESDPTITKEWHRSVSHPPPPRLVEPFLVSHVGGSPRFASNAIFIG